MSIPTGTRELARQRADYRCEYCGIHETDAGGELTIDHYRPRSHGGTDDPENLIYSCSRCNLYKHDYWPAGRDERRLWNPREEAFAVHFVELPGGILEPKSPTGAFSLLKLRLNRPQLVAHRQRRQQKPPEQLKQRGLYQGIVTVLAQLLSEQAAAANQQTELFQELRQLLVRLLDTRR